MNRNYLKERLKDILSQLEHDCSDLHCRIDRCKKIGTYGGCRCLPRNFARELLRLSEAINDAYPKYQDWKEETKP